TAMMKTRPEIKTHSRAVVGRIIIISWRIISGWRVWIARRRSNRWLGHIKDEVFRYRFVVAWKLPRAISARLRELICRDRQSANHEIIRTKIVKRSVWITEDFQTQRCDTHVLAVRFDLCPRRRRFHQNLISYRAIRTALCARRN